MFQLIGCLVRKENYLLVVLFIATVCFSDRAWGYVNSTTLQIHPFNIRGERKSSYVGSQRAGPGHYSQNYAPYGWKNQPMPYGLHRTQSYTNYAAQRSNSYKYKPRRMILLSNDRHTRYFSDDERDQIRKFPGNSQRPVNHGRSRFNYHRLGLHLLHKITTTKRSTSTTRRAAQSSPTVTATSSVTGTTTTVITSPTIASTTTAPTTQTSTASSTDAATTDCPFPDSPTNSESVNLNDAEDGTSFDDRHFYIWGAYDNLYWFQSIVNVLDAGGNPGIRAINVLVCDGYDLGAGDLISFTFSGAASSMKILSSGEGEGPFVIPSTDASQLTIDFQSDCTEPGNGFFVVVCVGDPSGSCSDIADRCPTTGGAR